MKKNRIKSKSSPVADVAANKESRSGRSRGRRSTAVSTAAAAASARAGEPLSRRTKLSHLNSSEPLPASMTTNKSSSSSGRRSSRRKVKKQAAARASMNEPASSSSTTVAKQPLSARSRVKPRLSLTSAITTSKSSSSSPTVPPVSSQQQSSFRDRARGVLQLQSSLKNHVSIVEKCCLAASFVPNIILERLLLKKGEVAEESSSASSNQIILFLDICGFTRLTASIGGSSPSSSLSAAESVRDLLCAFFTKVLYEIDAADGDCLKFAGDAIICSFPFNQALAAASCAMRIASIEHDYMDGDTSCKLRNRVALSSGLVEPLVLGNTRRKEFLIAGSPLASLNECLSIAKPRTVVVAPSLIDHLIEVGVQFHPSSSSTCRLISTCCPSSSQSFNCRREQLLNSIRSFPVEVHARIFSDLSRFLPRPAIVSLSSSMSAEIRQATVLFISISAEDNSQGHLQRAVTTCLFYIQRYGGMLRQAIIDDKGAVIILAFGVPSIAIHERSAELKAAMAISHSLLSNGIDHSIGMATGKVFCGNVGSRSRREFALVGDTVNVSARLMSAMMKQKGEATELSMKLPIFMDQATAAISSEVKTTEWPARLQLKGKDRPVPVFTPVSDGEEYTEELEEDQQSQPVVGSSSSIPSPSTLSAETPSHARRRSPSSATTSAADFARGVSTFTRKRHSHQKNRHHQHRPSSSPSSSPRESVVSSSPRSRRSKTRSPTALAAQDSASSSSPLKSTIDRAYKGSDGSLKKSASGSSVKSTLTSNLSSARPPSLLPPLNVQKITDRSSPLPEISIQAAELGEETSNTAGLASISRTASAPDSLLSPVTDDSSRENVDDDDFEILLFGRDDLLLDMRKIYAAFLSAQAPTTASASDAVERNVIVDESTHCLAIIGDAGSGKSALVSKFAQEIARADREVKFVGIYCSPLHSSQPFRVFAEFLSVTLIEGTNDDAECRQFVRQLLSEHPRATELSSYPLSLLKDLGLPFSEADDQEKLLNNSADGALSVSTTSGAPRLQRSRSSRRSSSSQQHLRTSSTPGSSSQPIKLEGRQRNIALREMCCALVQALARRDKRFLLVIENAHFADYGSLDVVLSLLRSSVSSHLFVCMVQRPVAEKMKVHASLERHPFVTQLFLHGGLDRSAISALARHFIIDHFTELSLQTPRSPRHSPLLSPRGLDGSRVSPSFAPTGTTAQRREQRSAVNLSDSLISLIVEKSDQSAFVCVEFLRYLVNERCLVKTEETIDLRPDANIEKIPLTVEKLIVSSIDRLSADAAALLKVAAVFCDGNEFFSMSDLIVVVREARILSLSEGQVSRLLSGELGSFLERAPAAAESLNQAQTHAELLEDSPPDERQDLQALVDTLMENANVFCFRHQLTKDVCYSLLTEKSRRRVHLAVAKRLQERGENLKGSTLALAHHFGKAGESSIACDYFARSAHDCYRLNAKRECSESLTHFFKLAPRASLSPLFLCSVFHLRGRLRRAQGQQNDALQDFKRCVAAVLLSLEGADDNESICAMMFDDDDSEAKFSACLLPSAHRNLSLQEPLLKSTLLSTAATSACSALAFIAADHSLSVFKAAIFSHEVSHESTLDQSGGGRRALCRHWSKLYLTLAKLTGKKSNLAQALSTARFVNGGAEASDGAEAPELTLRQLLAPNSTLFSDYIIWPDVSRSLYNADQRGLKSALEETIFCADRANHGRAENLLLRGALAALMAGRVDSCIRLIHRVCGTSRLRGQRVHHELALRLFALLRARHQSSVVVDTASSSSQLSLEYDSLKDLNSIAQTHASIIECANKEIVPFDQLLKLLSSLQKGGVMTVPTLSLVVSVVVRKGKVMEQMALLKEIHNHLEYLVGLFEDIGLGELPFCQPLLMLVKSLLGGNLFREVINSSVEAPFEKYLSHLSLDETEKALEIKEKYQFH